MATKPKVRLVPVTGKFCQANLQGKKYEIWRQLPNAPKDSLGTPVAYDVAVALLSLTPPVVALVPKVENGKFVSQLDEKDALAIKEAQQTGQVMISNAFNHLSEPNTPVKDESSAEVIQALKEQNLALRELLDAQKAENQAKIETLSEQIKTLTAQMSSISSATPDKGGNKPAGK